MKPWKLVKVFTVGYASIEAYIQEGETWQGFEMPVIPIRLGQEFVDEYLDPPDPSEEEEALPYGYIDENKDLVIYDPEWGDNEHPARRYPVEFVGIPEKVYDITNLGWSWRHYA